MIDKNIQLDNILQKVLNEGADDAVIHLQESSSKFIEYRDKNIDTVKESIQNALNIQVYLDNKYNVFSTSDLDERRLTSFIQNAVAATKYLSKDTHREILPAKYYPKQPNATALELDDSRCHQVTQDELLTMVSTSAKAAKEAAVKAISSASSISVHNYEKSIITSNGFSGTEKGTICNFSTEVTVQGENSRPEGWYSATTRYFNDLPISEDLGKTAAKRAMRKLNQSKVKSGKYTMIVENFAVTRLLNLLLEPLKAQAINQKRSYLSDKLGQKIASPLLTIEDNPHLKKGIGSMLFNSEGLEAKPFNLIEKGELKNFYIDNYYGKKLDFEPNAYGVTNLVVKEGDKNLSELIREINNGILVTEFIGGNANATTGNFSLGIYGQLIENGQLTKAVGEMNISENGTEFWDKLIAIGNDLITHSSIIRPSLVFEDVNFSGI